MTTRQRHDVQEKMRVFVLNEEGYSLNSITSSAQLPYGAVRDSAAQRRLTSCVCKRQLAG